MSVVDEELAAGLMRATFVSKIFGEVDLGMRGAFLENLRREADRLAPTVALNAAELTLRDACDAACDRRGFGEGRD